MLNCKKENCTGCGVCAYSCPKSAINMVESVEGFLYPKVDRSLCVDCNLCNKVCPSLKKPSIGDIADCYAVQLMDKTTLQHCASGGAFYGIAQTVLEQNGAVFGVVDFGTELRYQKATSLKELDELTGSKYFQCAISEKAYGEIIESTQKGLTLVSGTPCMVAAIRNLQRINHKNLLTFEILCQGVPSKNVIEKFYAETAAKYGSPVQNHVFRSKDRHIGRNYLNRYEFKNGKVVYLIGEEDPLSLSFQRQIFLRESCYSCQYANEARTADFTAGDLWKTDVNELDIERGCSVLLCNTSKAKCFLDETKVFLIGKINFKTALEHNIPYHHPVKRPKCRDWSYKLLCSGIPPKTVTILCCWKYYIKRLFTGKRK